MRKFRFLTLSVLLVASLILAACPAASPAAAPADDSSSDSGESMASDDAGESMSGDRTQVRWYVGLGTGSNEEQIPLQEAVVEEFNASQDEIELVVEFVDNAQATDILNTQIAAGNAPDIVGPVGVAGRAAFTDALLDITPFIESSGIDLSDFDPAMVDFYKLDGLGQIGLPFGVFPSFIYYNQDLFDEAGLAYPPAEYGQSYVSADGTEMPWDMNTIRELGMLLTVDANGNDATSGDFDTESIEQFGYGVQYTDMRGMATLFGPGWMIDDSGAAAVPDHWRDALQWYYDGMWTDNFMPNSVYGNSEILNAGNWFESGNMGMTHVHLWYATCCVAGLEANWNIAPMPAAPDGTITAKMHADTFSILKQSENPDAAFTVLQYMITDAASELAQIYGGLPARQSLQSDYFDTLDAGQFEGMDINWDVVTASMAYPDNPNHEEGYPGELQLRDVIAAFSEQLNNNPDFDVQAGLDEMIASMQEVFDAQ